MRILPTSIPDVLLIEPQIFRDERGFFLETFQARKYADAGLPAVMVQDNYSGSKQWVLRGLHYQVRQAQGKLISVAVGQIYDVAVDLRRSSATFGKWFGTYLSAEDRRQLWAPAGFAHGFLAVSPWAEVIYKTTDYYDPASERALAWDDPFLKVAWPLPEGRRPVLSPKDSNGVRWNAVEFYP
jgi:dTDP-4-dehydrorhamnose 3,5-epimerase